MKRKRIIVVVLGVGALVAVGVARRNSANRGRSVGGRDIGRSGDDALEVVEVETDDIDEEGNLVIDDLVVAVDGDGKIVATDETVAVLTPEGDAVVDETISVVGEDGELHIVEEDVAIVEAGEE
jgi:hypothetical protein